MFLPSGCLRAWGKKVQSSGAWLQDPVTSVLVLLPLEFKSVGFTVFFAV